MVVEVGIRPCPVRAWMELVAVSWTNNSVSLCIGLTQQASSLVVLPRNELTKYRALIANIPMSLQYMFSENLCFGLAS
jgi:hypothetical protein